MQFANCDAHQNYYRRFFKEKNLSNNTAKEFKDYIKFIFGFSLLFYSIALPINYLIFKSIIIGLCFSFILVFEKIADEFQRFNIFTKNYFAWSVLAIIMYALPAIFSILFFTLNKSNIFINYVYSSMVIDLFLLFYIIRSGKFLSYNFSKPSFSNVYINVKFAIGIYLKRFGYIIVNTLSGHALLVTRYIILFFEPLFFPLFVTCSSIIGGIATLVDVFYLAYKRKNYVSNPLEALTAIRSIRLISIIFLGGILSFIGCLGVFYFKDSMFDNNEIFAFIITMMGVIYSLSLLFYESIYWQKKINDRALNELIYFLGIIVLVLLSIIIEPDLLLLLLSLLFLLIIRFFTLYFIFIKK